MLLLQLLIVSSVSSFGSAKGGCEIRFNFALEYIAQEKNIPGTLLVFLCIHLSIGSRVIGLLQCLHLTTDFGILSPYVLVLCENVSDVVDRDERAVRSLDGIGACYLVQIIAHAE